MAGQVVRQVKSAAAGKGHGERWERVAWVQRCHLSHAWLVPAPRLRITGPELEDLAYQAAADALASSRNAIYKMLFDARRKLRAALAANGYLCDDSSRRS